MLNEKLRASCAIDTIVGQNSAPPACHKQSTGFALGAASPAPIALRSPTVMCATELASWAQIGRNSVPRLVADHGIRELTGQQRHQRFGVAEIIRRVLSITPTDFADFARLLVPLQTTEWVADITGMSRSTLSARARLGKLPFRPVDLFQDSPLRAAPRGRRWIAAQVVAHLAGTSIPFVEYHGAPSGPSSMPAGNGFAALWPSNTGDAR